MKSRPRQQPLAYMTHSPQVLTSLPPTSTETLVMAIAEAAEDRKAADLVILKVMDISYLADYFLISTGFSRAQVRAIADSIEKELEEKYQRLPLHTAGQSEGSWILQDYGDIIVHTFMPEERDYYGLESFWGHAQRLTLKDLAALIAD